MPSSASNPHPVTQGESYRIRDNNLTSITICLCSNANFDKEKKKLLLKYISYVSEIYLHSFLKNGSCLKKRPIEACHMDMNENPWDIFCSKCL